VVALTVVLEYQLPVAFLHQVSFEGYFAIFQVVRANKRRYGASKFLKIRCDLGHADIDVAVHNLAMSREEIVVCIVKVWAHVTGK
jgi:hypothetical protein